MYKQAYTNSSYGYGMAIGVVIFLFSFALSAIISGVTKREVLGIKEVQNDGNTKRMTTETAYRDPKTIETQKK